MNDGLRTELRELATVHTGLIRTNESDQVVVVSGTLTFDATPSGLERIVDAFEIEIRVPSSYPKDLPEVVETGGRIEAGYPHRNAVVGTMCLAAPVEARLTFLQQPSLLGFINRLVVPYLYGFAYWYRHGKHPFGELAHGDDGIAQYYRNSLSLHDDLAVLDFLSYVFEHGYRGHHDCPCRSGKRMRDCHGMLLRRLLSAHTAETLAKDVMLMFVLCSEKTKRGCPPIPASTMDRLQRLHECLRKATQQ